MNKIEAPAKRESASNRNLPRKDKPKTMMRANVFRGPNDIIVQEVPRPIAGIGEAVIRITLTTICGTDLHILRGEYPVKPGQDCRDNYSESTALGGNNADGRIRHANHRAGADKGSVGHLYSIAIAGILPLAAFLIPNLDADTRFRLSALMTAIAFTVIGAIKGVIVRRSLIRAGFETLLTGGTAAVLAYGIGLSLRQLYGA